MKNKILEKALQLTEAKRATYTLSERTSRLPKATGFALAYSYKDKDHKFVTKLTDLGGKVDRKNKEVRFDFKSASERTKFRKKNKEILSKLDESVELLDEAKDYRKELEKRHAEAIKIIWAIDTTFGRTKWTDSFGNYVTNKMPDDIDTSIDAGWAYHQNRGRGEWFFLIEPKDVVKYSYTGNAKIKSSEKSGRMKIGEFKKFIARVWALTKAKNESHLDEATREEPKVFWDFKSERDAKQFAKDVENSGVGLANSGVERYKGKYRVVITGMTKDMHKKAIGKYAHKNKGKFSHSTSEVTPKGYGPYDESVEYMSEEDNWTLSIDFDRSMTDQEIKALSNKFKKHFIGSGSDRFGGSDMGFEGPKSDLLKIKQYIEKVFKSQINKKNTFFVPE